MNKDEQGILDFADDLGQTLAIGLFYAVAFLLYLPMRLLDLVLDAGEVWF